MGVEFVRVGGGQNQAYDDIEITFTGSTSNSGAWRCKSGLEQNSACSSNYEHLATVLDANNRSSRQFVQADSVPCYLDTVQIDGDASVTGLDFSSR